MKLAIGADHGGYILKKEVLEFLSKIKNIEVTDHGTSGPESVDYPDFGRMVALAVSRGDADRGLLVCGTGQGMAMTANRYRRVRAAVPCDEETARLSREHNDANVLALGGRTLDPALAARILEVWLETPFAGGRHERRVRKIDET